jgi:hypothetical protein
MMRDRRTFIREAMAVCRRRAKELRLLPLCYIGGGNKRVTFDP